MGIRDWFKRETPPDTKAPVNLSVPSKPIKPTDADKRSEPKSPPQREPRPPLTPQEKAFNQIFAVCEDAFDDIKTDLDFRSSGVGIDGTYILSAPSQYARKDLLTKIGVKEESDINNCVSFTQQVEWKVPAKVMQKIMPDVAQRDDEEIAKVLNKQLAFATVKIEKDSDYYIISQVPFIKGQNLLGLLFKHAEDQKTISVSEPLEIFGDKKIILIPSKVIHPIKSITHEGMSIGVSGEIQKPKT